MGKTVGVVLAGCGYLDGSEITEAVLSLYFLERGGVAVRCFAPDRDQMHVVDHRTGEPTTEVRNVLTEAARIARGKVEPLSSATMAELDGLMLPGGFGMAKNLSSFAMEGPRCTVDRDLVRLLQDAVAAKKPVAAVCISPAVLAAALRDTDVGATVTIGDDAQTAAAIEALGCTHETCPVSEAVTDEEHRIVTAPAYMDDGADRGAIGSGIEAAVSRLLAWLGS